MTKAVPLMSVIVPAYQAASLLPDTLGALVASDLPRDQWELIVVDDASSDDTSAVAAQFANRVLTLRGSPRGPGTARNAGAGLSEAAWLVFIDADVRVHSDTLSRIDENIQRNPDVVAIFGSYDDSPNARGLVSQYRNLLHRYVHLRGAGDAETFWAGCGAVRRSAFAALNGFDTVRFPRPQIEDIELGYRLRDNGGRIVLDPAIQGTHLKKWTLWKMLRTDILDRGIPWMRLMLERRGRNRTSLNTGAAEQIKVLLAGAAAVLIVVGIAGRLRIALLLGVASLALLLLWNLPVLRFFARLRGVSFAAATVPLHLIHYGTSALSATVGLVLHFSPAGRSMRVHR
jgi:glycosyltransferase involved in cell wall biosynthesis